MKSTLFINILITIILLLLSCDKPQVEIQPIKETHREVPPIPSFPVSSHLQKQKTCPFKGTPIKKQFYVDQGNKRIFTCCVECIVKVRNSPQVTETLINARGERVMTIQEAKAAFP